MNARYSIEVIDQGRDGIIVDHILARESDLDSAHALYKFCITQFPNRVFLLTDRARVLVRSDFP